jgi:hypothetical protein
MNLPALLLCAFPLFAAQADLPENPPGNKPDPRQARRKSAPAQKRQAPVALKGEVVFSADPRIELAGTVQLLSGVTPPRFKVPDDARIIQRRFNKFQQHAAVQRAKGLAAWDFIDRYGILIQLSPPPKLIEQRIIKYQFVNGGGGQAKVDAWLDGLADFARETHFLESFAPRRKALNTAASRIARDAEEQAIVPSIIDYAGERLRGRYDVFVTPFAEAGAVFNNVTWLAGGARIVTVYGEDQAPVRELTCNSRDLAPTMWHELGHGLFDPYAEMFDPEIAAREPEGFAPQDCYGSWKQCVKEHVVRAVVIRLLEKSRGQTAAKVQLNCFWEFPYLAEMVEELKKYEQDRKRWSTVGEFYPNLLSVIPKRKEVDQRKWFTQAPYAFPSRTRGEAAMATLKKFAARTQGEPQLRYLARRAALAYHLGYFKEAAADAQKVLGVQKNPLAALVAPLATGCGPSATCPMNRAPAFHTQDEMMSPPRQRPALKP